MAKKVKVKVKGHLRKGKFVKEHLRNNNWSESGKHWGKPKSADNDDNKVDYWTQRALDKEKSEKEALRATKERKKPVRLPRETFTQTLKSGERSDIQSYVYDYLTSGGRKTEGGAAKYAAERLHNKRNSYGPVPASLKRAVKDHAVRHFQTMNGDIRG